MSQQHLFGMEPEEDPDKALVLSALGRIRVSLCDAWFDGFDNWRAEITDTAKAQLTSRSRACCVNDFAVESAKQLLAGVEGVELDVALGFFKIYVDDRFVVRLKRLNGNRLARNVKTAQQRDYYLDRPINGIRNWCTRITAGYLLTPAEDAIENVFVTRQYGQRTLIWSDSLLDGPDTMQTPVPLAPKGPVPPSIIVPGEVGKSQGG